MAIHVGSNDGLSSGVAGRREGERELAGAGFTRLEGVGGQGAGWRETGTLGRVHNAVHDHEQWRQEPASQSAPAEEEDSRELPASFRVEI